MGLNLKIRWFALLCLLLVIVGLPRFDRMDHFGIGKISSSGKGTLGDAEFYIDHIRYFRGEVGEEQIRAPYAWRPFSVALAAPLPFSPMRSLNIINVLAMLVSLIFLLRVLNLLGIRPGTSFLGALLYILSFPTFYYSTIGYIDPILIMILMIGVELVITGNTAAMILLTVASSGINEKFVIILPFWLLYDCWIHHRKLSRTLGFVILAAVLFMAGYQIIRFISPSSRYGWYLDWKEVIGNFIRPRAWISLFLTLGPLGLFLILYLMRHFRETFKDKVLLALWIGAAGGLGVWVYSFFTCYADGRYVWLCYPFMVPLFCWYFDKYDTVSEKIKSALSAMIE